MSSSEASPDGPVWSSVKFDIADLRFEDGANEWFSHHVADLTQRDGMMRAWRTVETSDSRNIGADEQRFFSTYVMDSPERFAVGPRSNPSAPPPPPPPPDPDRTDFNARTDLINWGRVFYEPLDAFGETESTGGYWIREEFEPDDSDAFEKANAADYLPAVSALAGVRRVWQLRLLDTELQIGPNPPGRYLHVFEVDAPESLLDAPRPDVPDGRGGAAELKARHISVLAFQVEHTPTP